MLTARIAEARATQEALLDRVALTLAETHSLKVEPALSPAQTIDQTKVQERREAGPAKSRSRVISPLAGAFVVLRRWLSVRKRPRRSPT
jgi:hypothetical protein